MHYLLVGPGALGSLLYSLVSKGLRSDDKLTILDYNQQRAQLLSDQGVTYHLNDCAQKVEVTAVSDPKSLDHVDVVLLCVKSYDVQNSLNYCEPILGDSTLLLFLQNGIAHLNFQESNWKAASAYGTTTEGATLLQPGHVRHAGSGETFLGFLAPPDDHFTTLLRKTAEVFQGGGIKVQVTEDILTRIWTKLFINVAINALTATLDCKNGELLTIAGVTGRMQKAVEEAVLIAQKQNITILNNPYQTACDVCEKTAGNISSMLQDVHRKRRTEIDAINGAIVSLGKELGIETPENNLLSKQVKELEATFSSD